MLLLLPDFFLLENILKFKEKFHFGHSRWGNCWCETKETIKIWIWFYQINCVLSNHSKVQGPVVRGPISTSSRLNCNLGLLIPLFKSHFGIVFCVLFRASNSHIPDKEKFDWIFFKAFRSEIIFHTKPGLT